MKIKIEIDSRDLRDYTTIQEDRELAESFYKWVEKEVEV